MNFKNESYSWLPAGNENLASSRLRCFYLHRELQKFGFLSYIGSYKYASTFVIQKRLDFRALLFIYIAKFYRAKIILDIDDVNPGDKIWESRISTFCNLVDAITSATAEQLILVKKCLTEDQIKRVTFFHFENPIDYNYKLKNSHSISSKTINEPLNIGWFGNSSNFNLDTEFKFINQLGHNLVIISDANPYNDNKFNNLKYIKWDRENFDSQLISNIDICILSHYGDKLTESKSANKMIASIAIGVPVIASNTPAYSKIGKIFGIDEYLYTNVYDIEININKLKDNISRKNYLNIRNTPLFLEYTSEKVAQNFNNFSIQLKKKNIVSVILYYKAFLTLLKLKLTSLRK